MLEHIHWNEGIPFWNQDNQDVIMSQGYEWNRERWIDFGFALDIKAPPIFPHPKSLRVFVAPQFLEGNLLGWMFDQLALINWLWNNREKADLLFNGSQLEELPKISESFIWTRSEAMNRNHALWQGFPPCHTKIEGYSDDEEKHNLTRFVSYTLAGGSAWCGGALFVRVTTWEKNSWS